MAVDLRLFQRRFVTAALRPGIDTAALSMPRGNGKSWLAAHVRTGALTPGDPLHQGGAEYLLCAASIEQARLCFRFVRSALESTGAYRFLDSATRIVGCPLAVADEPGSWEVTGGQLMADALMTAQGKPGSTLRLLMIGTLAPAVSGWWHDLIAAGSHDSTYVQSLQGDPKTWDRWSTIRKANPLTAISPEFRRKLREERDKARSDSRLRARFLWFLSYRLNVPTADESAVLLSVDDWMRVTARPVPEPAGRPVVSVDLGAGRSWSAAVALWPNGRTEAAERTRPRRRRPRHAPAASLRLVSGALRRVGLSFASRSATRSVPLLRTCPLD